MQAAPELTPSAAAAIQSPGLDQFRKSPFRALRLATSVTPQQALWQGEKVLARVRVGMPLPGADPVPWLAPATELEIMDAVQVMEQPLARLVEQLLWFDFAAGPHGPALQEALAGADAEQLGAYCEATENESLDHKLNRLNLRLLLGFSALRGVGPMPKRPRGGEHDDRAPAWKQEGRRSTIEDPHQLLRERTALGGFWATVLTYALRTWSRFLSSSKGLEHVRAKITALGDETLGPDDAEVVVSALRTRIADLVVGEAKLELQRGRLENVGYLADLAGKSEIGPEVWLAAFKPLRAQHQADLAALAPEAATGAGPLADMAAYLDRLATLVARWRKVDAANLLGLATMIDEAVGEAFGRLRGFDAKLHHDPRFAELLGRIGQLAASSSIRDRVATYAERIQRTHAMRCHFCSKNEAEAEYSGFVSESQSTYTRELFRTIVHTRARAGIVPRCQPCALLHRYIHWMGRLPMISMMISILIAFSLFIGCTPGMFEAKAVGALVAILGLLLAVASAHITRRLVAVRFTPANSRQYDDYRTSIGVAQLAQDGFLSPDYNGSYRAYKRFMRRV
jgi:hypothetical protein